MLGLWAGTGLPVRSLWSVGQKIP